MIIRLDKSADTDPGIMKIQVCSDDIIRVVAAPEKTFSKRASLVVERHDWNPVDWSVKEQDGYIIITTTKLTTKIHRKTGVLAFYKADGEPILQECDKRGKSFTAAEVMGEKTYHIQQRFNSPADEAFYGLGQHQNAVMNYKNQDVDLWQYNIVAAVPFLVSSKNYGILWDNNSRTKFGDIRDYEAISSLKLWDKDGNAGGLSAEYFETADFKQLQIVRREKRIAHEFIDVNDEYPEGFDINRGSIHWSGEIEGVETGVYKFRLYGSSYIKVWLNGEPLVDQWRQNWLPWTHILKLPMEAGKRYPIKIEWVPNGGFIGLQYLAPELEFSQNQLSLWSEVADQIDYYFIFGETPDEVISGYRQITGRATMLPKWALGFWQCRERYKTQEELLGIVKEFRQRGIPLDNVVQDWFYWEENKWGDHEFDKSRYLDPAAMVSELHDKLNTHIMISVWPKFYVGTENYDKFNAQGWLYSRNVEMEQRDWVGPGYVSTFYDPYSEGAGKLFWEGINEKLFSLGIDAWWLDATEPDIQSNLSREETRLRNGPTALGTAARYLNTYSLVNSKSVYEGQRAVKPDQRVFILTRSAYAGQQRYAATTWSGDIASRWYDLKAQISAGLNFSLSGLPYWTTDIGGFAVERRYENAKGADLDEWRELNTRWFQFGTFCPLFRVHGQYPFREMFNIAPDDHPAYQTMLAYDKLRYRLMPYIYSLAGMVTRNDYTIMRALVMDFGEDLKVLNIGDQFMFGPALLINPVVEYKARERTLYLPTDCGWYALRTGQYFEGGQEITADAPYTDIPIFVKAGSIVPFGPEIQYAAEKAADPIILYIYTGQDGHFTLYEDEGNNYNYEKGEFALIPFDYHEANRTLTIGKRQGDFDGMLNQRTFQIVGVSENQPTGLNFGIEPHIVVEYNGSEQSVKLN